MTAAIYWLRLVGVVVCSVSFWMTTPDRDKQTQDFRNGFESAMIFCIGMALVPKSREEW